MGLNVVLLRLLLDSAGLHSVVSSGTLSKDELMACKSSISRNKEHLLPPAASLSKLARNFSRKTQPFLAAEATCPTRRLSTLDP